MGLYDIVAEDDGQKYACMIYVKYGYMQCKLDLFKMKCKYSIYLNEMV